MKHQCRQHGATLITALVMLIVLTLLVISAIRSSSTNLRIAGNMQIKEEAIAAAQQATELVISNNFSGNPAAAASSVGVDINKDGVVDYTANVQTPLCNNSTNLPANQPNLPSQCYASGKYDPNGMGGSNCAAQQWDVQTTVVDAITGAAATLHQGVAVTVLKDTQCP
ncbi:MAG TPA: pilus assembly PilX N-terminal domain-containing protein [Gallionellaceae bacterium]